MKEVNNILRILEEAKIAIRREDVVHLRKLSDQTIHSASVYQDPEWFELSTPIFGVD